MPNTTITYFLNQTKEDAIHDWIVAATGLDNEKVIWELQDGDRPGPPFISLSISSGPQKMGTPPVTYKELDTYIYRFQKTFTLTVNIYSYDKHLQSLSNLLNARDLPTLRNIMRNAGLAIYGNSPPFDVSDLVETDHELRWTVDFFLAYGEDIEDVPGEIQTVRFKGIGDLDSLKEQTITAP
jgi:hypothetical protein